MPTQVTSAFRRFGDTLRAFTIAQRTVAIIGLAVLALGIAALAMWAAKPSYSPLFTGLSATDASTIVEQLRADGVAYELTNGGGTILVPEANVYQERLTAAAAGLPSSSTGGYSLLDKMGVTSSEFQQSVTYKRALEGELAATIQAMKGVKAASVRLAIPEDTVFVSEKNDPTASVFVETANGVTLTNDQVQAIVHLTSASIDGMAATDVAVIDSKGEVLSAVGVGATGSASSQVTEYETRVKSSVQAMLDKVVGVGNATVVVAADMSTESANRVAETFTSPEGAPVLNEATKTEDYTGTGGTAAGVLGPDNIAVPGDADGNGTFTSEDTTRNNAVNKITETRTIPAGSLNRQTISVAVDRDAADNVRVADISALVSTAAGIDPARGDEVTVQLVSFSTAGATAAAEALAEAEAQAAASRMTELIKIGIVVLGILGALVAGVILYARRSRRQTREAIELGEFMESRTAIEDATMPIGIEPMPAPLPVLSAEAADSDRQRAEIDAMAGRDPHQTAEFLRSLMDDRQNA